MVAEVRNNLSKIVEACRDMQLKSLYLVGSGAREDDYTSESDLDFMYSMIVDETGVAMSRKDYFDVMWKLEEITGRKVDLIPGEKIRNKYFLKSILEDKVKIYEA